MYCWINANKIHYIIYMYNFVKKIWNKQAFLEAL